jgi:DNA-binding SARP family transcriptional activator/tetratricopeptide (TPR) repeat protein
MASVIEVSLLGPPRVERDGTLVAFDTRKALAVLALLAVTDRPRTRDGLADLLWPAADPDHARGALRRTLSTLRAAVGADLLETTNDHVRLVKGSGVVVDVDRFHDLCARGDLDSAVTVFRGDFLEGFTVRDATDFEDWVRLEGDGLRRRLTNALALLTQEREAAGDALAALASARRWLDVDQLHEPAHQALIRLYASVGDRAAALSQYRECVRTLDRELGVHPLPETTELYEAVLGGSYQPPPAPIGPPARVVPLRPPFVGRSAELATLRREYDAVELDGRVVLVEGEAGIGKTRLAVELLTGVRGDRARVVAARAYEEEVGLAYAPVVEMVRRRLREGTGWLTKVSDDALRETARLVPEVVLPDRGVADLPEVHQPGDEIRFLSGVWETLLAAARGPVPGVLFIDDAHWADDATLGLLAYGLRRLAGEPVLVVLTWRSPHDHPLRHAVLASARDEVGTVVSLGRLGREAVTALVRAVRGDDEGPGEARRLWERSEGVPLVLVEYLRIVGADDPGELPRGVRDLLAARLDQLSGTGRQVLAAAAVLGRSFDVEAVRAVSGRTEDETVTALEELVGRGLVVERRFDYDFVHELQRTLVHDETGLARRRLLHGRAAGLPGVPAGSTARHLQLAGRDAEAAEAFRTAGRLARQVFANGEALEHFRAALALGHPDRIGLLIAVGDLQTVTGDYPGALLTLEAAASECASDELAAVEQRLGRLQHRRGEHLVAQAHFQAALAAVAGDDVALRAGVTADLSLAAHSLGDVQVAQELAQQARDLAAASGDDRTLCQADGLLGMLATERGDLDDAVAVLARSRDLATRLGDPELQVGALNNLALAHRARQELDVAVGLTQEALALCTTTGDRHHEAALHNNLADLLHLTGDAELAMTHLKAAVELLAGIGAQEEPQAGIWKLVRW